MDKAVNDGTGSPPRCPQNLAPICRRVREKIQSYDEYNFSPRYNDFLKAFFDLGQEYDSLDDFYRICVAVPLQMKSVPCALYLFDEKKGALQLICDTDEGLYPQPEPAPPSIHLLSEAYEKESSYIVPIYSRSIFHTPAEDPTGENWFKREGIAGSNKIFGMLEVRQLENLTASDKFFYQKYCNRIGYNLYNKLIAQQNIEHLKFINSLVMDIEHNIIIPNMYFKHIFNQLKKKILEISEIRDAVNRLEVHAGDREQRDVCLYHCAMIQQEMMAYHSDLVKHHANISLFLESLFRREHFKKGHLVLRPRRCFVEKEIILPQLEHYASRLRLAKVDIDRPLNMLEEEFEILVDVGLLAQVYANLFSNAAKYAVEIIDHEGRPRKAVAYGRELVEDFPEKGKQGIKFNVFTTGPHLDPEVAEKLFEEGVRGVGTENIPGTGHGLAFIKHVIELHGGRVGYEPTREGNNFYFILPVPSSNPPMKRGDGKY
ncbi:MAG TPA: HAMP domain-containing histidine kinase [Desulfobacteraceae bacterium]|nr:HAMP domain-containing histidine kinase [Desulfobacteraceae bacterium]